MLHVLRPLLGDLREVGRRHDPAVTAPGDDSAPEPRVTSRGRQLAGFQIGYRLMLCHFKVIVR